MMSQEAPLLVPDSSNPTGTVEERFRELLFCRTFEIDSCRSLAYSLSLKKLSVIDSTLSFKYPRGVRGGMLCDEPGLGKTISMLAIILKSIGASTVALKRQDTCNQGPEMKGLRSPSSRRRSVSHLTLLSSKTTLILAPDSLLTHWRDQINLHVNISLALKVFVDFDFSQPLPPAEELAKFDIVITAFRYLVDETTLTNNRRLSSEWSHGKPTCKLDEKKRPTFEEEFQGDIHTSIYITPKKSSKRASSVVISPDQQTNGHISELLKIHWLR